MAPSSLKKMSGSKGGKEGNYASSDGSTSLDGFTSDNLGLTLLPRPQVQKKDVGEKVQAAVGRPTTLRATEQQGDNQRCPLELEEQCQPVTRRSTVDESIGGSCYFGLSKRVEKYSNTGSDDDEAILRPDDCCSGTDGNHDLKRKGLSLPTETISKDIGQGLHHDRKANTEYSRAPYQCSLTKEGREIQRDILFKSSNQMLGEEMRKVGFNGASDSLGSVLGNEHKCDRNSDAKARENLLKHESCGSKGKKSENLLLTSASGNIGGLTLTKPMTDNRLSRDYPISLPNGSARRPYHSTRTSESENPISVVPETNSHSHIASALLAPVELQNSSKAIPTAHQQALNSLQVSPQLILKPSKASRNAHAAPSEKASKSVKHLKRSWTRHFPTRTKDLRSKGQGSDHAYTSSATPSCSIASETYSNPLKTCFARENRYKIVTHLDSRILATSPPISIEIFSQASYGLECDSYNQVADTGTVQSRLKAGIERSITLPDLRLLHQTSNMSPQQGHQQQQYSAPRWEQHSVGDNLQCLDPNYTFLPTHYAVQSTPRDIPGDINTPLTGMDYQGMNANISQPGQSPANSNIGAPIYGRSPFRVSIYGDNPRTVINWPASTNDGLINSNGERSYTTTEFMTLSEQCDDLRQRVRNHEDALQQAREHSQTSEATIEKLKRVIKVLRQQLESETLKEAKSPKDGVKTKSSRSRGVASTVQWARQSHPTAGEQSLNVRSASSENISIPLTNDGPSLESGATMNTMVSPTQHQYAAVPALAHGYPSAQANHIQSPYSGSFQPEVQSRPSPYDSADSLNPTCSPYLTYSPNHNYSRDPLYSPYLTYPPEPHLSGQYSSHGSQPGHPFQNQGNQFQEGPGDYSGGYYQQSPQPSVSRTPSATVQAEASTSGIKRKRETEPDATQGVERQQQPVENQPGLSPEQAASDKKAQDEAWKKMLRKDFPWYDGSHPTKHNLKDGKQFGISSASLPQVTTHPALAPHVPNGFIAPTPGKAPRKTKQKTPTMRKVPKTDEEKKRIRAQYNRTYKARQKAKECLQKNKAAANLEASETNLPLFTANSHAGLLPYRLLDSAQEDYADINPQSSYSNKSDLDEAFQNQQPHGTTSSSSTSNPNPDSLSLEDQALAAEFEAAMMEMEDDDPTAQAADDATDRTMEMEDDDPTAQAVDDATERIMEMEDDDPTAQAVEDATKRTINEIINGDDDEEEEESEESEEE